MEDQFPSLGWAIIKAINYVKAMGLLALLFGGISTLACILDKILEKIGGLLER